MSIIFLNNNYINDETPFLSHRDSGFTTGIGIFDSMLVKNKQPIHINEHFERVMHDSKIVIGLQPYCSPENFAVICQELIERNNIRENFVRIRTTVTGGVVKAPLLPATMPTVLIEARPSADPANVTTARCIIVSDFPRISGCSFENCKRLDYSRSYAARRMAEKLGGDEAILTNTDGNAACASTSNLFIEENGVMITPPLSDGVLAGVTRRKLIEERGAIEESISLERLKSADKIYLTNSFLGVRKAILIN
jgi:branched-chain amino acid aminotransferase